MTKLTTALETSCYLGLLFLLGVAGWAVNEALAYTGIHPFGDWIEFTSFNRTRLEWPVPVTIASIVPGVSHYSPGAKCLVDQDTFEIGLELHVLGKEPGPSGDYLVAVAPYAWSNLPKLGFCGASKVFISPANLGAIRLAAKTQVTLAQQATNPTMTARMSNVQ